jgi:hypothetical protein
MFKNGDNVKVVKNLDNESYDFLIGTRGFVTGQYCGYNIVDNGKDEYLFVDEELELLE